MRCESDSLPSYKQLRTPETILYFALPPSLYVWVRVLGRTTWGTYCPSICYTPIKSSYLGLPTTFSGIVSCYLLMYSLILKSIVISNAASAKAHSCYLLLPFIAVIPDIRLAILWWNNSITAIIVSVSTQIYLLYRSTTWTTALYIIARALIVDPSSPAPL